ncbi:hypothetical protein PIB30_100275, partial [Stylosanthes scabra]|nr:hypothetical protein [Stylosanthes scabra]
NPRYTWELISKARARTEAPRYTWRRPRITWSESKLYMKPTYEDFSSPSTPLQTKINLPSIHHQSRAVLKDSRDD